MNAKLRSILVLLGVTVSGLAVYTLAPGVTKGDAVDAGVGACPAVDAICPVFKSDGGYGRKRVKARDCRALDAGFILPPAPAGTEWFRVEKCRKAATDNLEAEGDSADEAFECACRGGTCRVTVDGSLVLAPFGETLGPGYRHETFSGAGCVPKSCDALAGPSDDSWPGGCPQ